MIYVAHAGLKKEPASNPQHALAISRFSAYM